MSAGDVKFIGWTGGSIKYRELIPSISYEPFSVSSRRPISDLGITSSLILEEYIRKRLTRQLICFSKDKDALIASLQPSNNTLFLTYIDSDGSIKTKNYGNGWSILTIDDSPAATGYSKVVISYEKAELRAFSFPGVDGLEIDCSDGVCRIRYNGNTLESFDAGTGACTTGLQINFERVTSSPRNRASIDIDQLQQYQDDVYFRAAMICNGVVFDFVEILGSQLPQAQLQGTWIYKSLESSTFEKAYPTFESAQNAADIWQTKNSWNNEQKANAIAGLRTEYADKNLVSYDIAIEENATRSYRPDFFGQSEIIIPGITGTIVSATITRRAVIKPLYRIPASGNLSAKWILLGSKLSLRLVGDFLVNERSRSGYSLTWREYDLAGLS